MTTMLATKLCMKLQPIKVRIHLYVSQFSLTMCCAISYCLAVHTCTHVVQASHAFYCVVVYWCLFFSLTATPAPCLVTCCPNPLHSLPLLCQVELTALILAALRGHVEVADVLLREGANVTLQDEVCMVYAMYLSSVVVPVLQLKVQEGHTALLPLVPAPLKIFPPRLHAHACLSNSPRGKQLREHQTASCSVVQDPPCLHQA